MQELVVTPRAACLSPVRDPAAPIPKVVSSFPARGAVVRPGLLVVRVTFDRPMSCRGLFLRAPGGDNPCDGPDRQMVLSLDRRTVRTLCRVTAGQAYALRLSTGAARGFVSLAGRAPEPYVLTFSTFSGPRVATIPEALAQDRAPASQLSK